jgi:putative ABC transport system permease protein
MPSQHPPSLRTDAEGSTGRCVGTIRRVTPEYFAVLDLRAESGRLLRDDDRGVAVASAALARRCWEGTAVDRAVTLGGAGLQRRVRVIGVVSSTGGRAARSRFEGTDLYVPYADPAGDDGITVVVAGPAPMAAHVADAAAIVRRASDGRLELEDAEALDQLVARELSGPRTLTAVLGVLGAVALLLATAGIYASLSQLLARRRRDFGVRAALGASPISLVRLTVGRDSLLVAIGSVTGLGVTLAVTRTAWPDALRIGGGDPRMWLTLGALLVVSGLVASAGPALRAVHLDPVDALRRGDE